MATAKLYLDTRTAKQNGTYPLKLKITLSVTQGTMLNLQISILPSQWDKMKCVVVNHPLAADINARVYQKLNAANIALWKLDAAGTLV
ncbi:MAG: Arm DNA-binding domain-containing protein [Alistipes sp.]